MTYDSTVQCQQETHFKYSNIGKLKVKGWEKTILTLNKKSDKIYVRAKKILGRKKVPT